MKNKAKTETPLQHRASATVVDGKLILSLPDAAMPVVWQMDLEETKSAALEIREDKKAKQFILSLKNESGDITEIAPYDSKENAVTALMEASSALQGARNHIRPAAAIPANSQNPAFCGPADLPARKSKCGGKTGAILAVLMIVILMSVWMFSITKKAPSYIGGSTSEQAAAGTGEPGVAVSADDFLNNR